MRRIERERERERTNDASRRGGGGGGKEQPVDVLETTIRRRFVGGKKVTTAETSEYSIVYRTRLGREDARGTRTTLKRTREEEMRVLVDAFEPELEIEARKRTWDFEDVYNQARKSADGDGTKRLLIGTRTYVRFTTARIDFNESSWGWHRESKRIGCV